MCCLASLFPFTIPLPCQKLRVEIIKGRGNAACGKGNNARNTAKVTTNKGQVLGGASNL